MKKTNHKTKPGDWRRRPRKPAEQKRTLSRNFHFSPVELQNLKSNAAAAKMTMTDFIVARCCNSDEPS
jgi:hypothetical protein